MQLFAIIPQPLGILDSPTFAGLTVTSNSVLGLNSAVFQPAADSTTFFQVLEADSGTPILNVDTFNERVSVGTATPTTKFEVHGAAGQFATMRVSGDYGVYQMVARGGIANLVILNIRPLATSKGYIKYTHEAVADRWSLGVESGDANFYLREGGETGTIRQVWDGANFGIGTFSAPVQMLHLHKSDSAHAYAHFTNSTTGALGTDGFTFGLTSTEDALIWLREATNMRFATSGTERLRITAAGDFGFRELAPETLTEWTHTAPYLTIHNSTHEDTDGGRESRINFKGEQGVDPFEETTLARIEVSHDGSGADDKGKIVFSTNDGDDSDTPTNHVAIDAAGNTKIGDAGTTNYLNVDSGGRVLLVGTAQTWEDIRIVPGAFQFPGVADPTLQSWQPGGAGTTYKVYKFVKNDEVHFTCQIPHNYKEGSDLKPHLHWTPCDRGNEEDGNTVGWKIDYSWANTDAAFASSATVDLSNACSGTDDQHELTDSGTITGTNKAISSILQIRLYRSDTNADDTWVGATAALSPAILEFDLHYEVDSLGSDLELVKDAP